MSGAAAIVALVVGALLLVVGDGFLGVVIGLWWAVPACVISCAAAWSNRGAGGVRGGRSPGSASTGPTSELDVIDVAWAEGFEVVAPPAGLPAAGTDQHPPTTY